MVYAFGLGEMRYRGHRCISHNGGINGFLSHLGYWPQDDLTVVVLSNSTSFPIQQVTHALVRRALGLPDATRQEVAASDAELAACEGVYRFDVGPLRMRVKDGGLAAAFPAPRSVYRPTAPGVYFLEGDPEVTLSFEDLDGGAGYRTAALQAYGGETVKGARVLQPA
jgi:hypothetical protein